jgi:hypothetical protein
VRAVWGLAQGLFTTASKTDGLYLYNFSTVPLLSELLKLVRGRAPSPLCPPYTSPCRAGATCQHIRCNLAAIPVPGAATTTARAI